MSGAASQYAAPTPPDNTVAIVAGGQKISGWQDISITRGIERFPSSFTIALTELYPGDDAKIVIQPSDPCVVTIGSDTILSGYIDRYSANIGPGRHQVSIDGRSMCEDLVDCSAQLQSFQVSNTTLVALATKLATPFGITVNAPDGDSIPIPQFSVILTETPYEILERVARYAAFLIYDAPNGNLMIARVGNTTMASGFTEGVNVLAASVGFTMDNRYTQINPVYMSTSFMTDGGPGDSVSLPYIPGASEADNSMSPRLDGKPRFRPLIIQSDQTLINQELVAQRAQWEMARRIGRSQALHLTVDSWRDSAGALWAPNSLAPIDMPSMKLANVTWLITEVTFRQNEQGTTADLVLMPKEAFTLLQKADLLVPFDWAVARDINASQGASATPPRNTSGAP